MSYAVDALADFVVAADSAHLSDGAVMLLRRNVLDSLGCAIAALDGETVCLVRDQVESVGGQPRASLIGGGRSSVDQAALFNSVAVRFPAEINRCANAEIPGIQHSSAESTASP